MKEEWRVLKNGLGCECGVSVDGQQIAVDTCDPFKDGHPHKSPRSHLISAARELLDACKEALVTVDEAFEATGYIRVGKTSVQRLKLESAIMKAEGVTTTITDDQIRALRDSYAGGNGQMADVCTYALLGMLAARVMCEKALADPASPLR